eukprot:7762339-Lingulodinium_polyedra.AAC.1
MKKHRSLNEGHEKPGRPTQREGAETADVAAGNLGPLRTCSRIGQKTPTTVEANLVTRLDRRSLCASQ